MFSVIEPRNIFDDVCPDRSSRVVTASCIRARLSVAKNSLRMRNRSRYPWSLSAILYLKAIRYRSVLTEGVTYGKERYGAFCPELLINFWPGAIRRRSWHQAA
jgi:hypothetical protein